MLNLRVERKIHDMLGCIDKFVVLVALCHRKEATTSRSRGCLRTTEDSFHSMFSQYFVPSSIHRREPPVSLTSNPSKKGTNNKLLIVIIMSADPKKANLFQSMALGGLAASFAVNFTHPIVSASWIDDNGGCFTCMLSLFLVSIHEV
jgi:hypothetical protein